MEMIDASLLLPAGVPASLESSRDAPHVARARRAGACEAQLRARARSMLCHQKNIVWILSLGWPKLSISNTASNANH